MYVRVKLETDKKRLEQAKRIRKGEKSQLVCCVWVAVSGCSRISTEFVTCCRDIITAVLYHVSTF